jgi:hypothetical protein
LVGLKQEKISTKRRGEILQKSYKHLRRNDIKGFCSLIANVDLPSGTSAMLEVVGVGKIMPNILFIGFKNDWRVCDKNSLSQYFATIQSVFLYLPTFKSNCTHTVPNFTTALDSTCTLVLPSCAYRKGSIIPLF